MTKQVPHISSERLSQMAAFAVSHKQAHTQNKPKYALWTWLTAPVAIAAIVFVVIAPFSEPTPQANAVLSWDEEQEIFIEESYMYDLEMVAL